MPRLLALWVLLALALAQQATPALATNPGASVLQLQRQQRQQQQQQRSKNEQHQALLQKQQKPQEDEELRRAADVSKRLAGTQQQQQQQQQQRHAHNPGSSQDTHQIKNGGNQFYSVADLVTPYGYPLEEHFVQTSDGYILRMFRIPHGRPSTSSSSSSSSSSTSSPPGPGSSRPSSPAPAALLQHGLLDSAAEFLLLGPGKALALLLADAGFDVWLPNSRGNALSRNHTHLGTGSNDYWAFSFDEMAAYDLPAELDYVLQATGQAQLSYVGFSQGSTIALAALSSHPELVKRINVAVLMAPVAFLAHIRSLPLLVLAAMDTDMVFQLLGVHEFLPSQRLVQLLEGQLCFLEPWLCLNILAAISGFDGGNINATQLPLYLQYTPAGASVQTMAHWAQCVRQPLPHTLSHFDWGSDCSATPRRPWGHCNLVQYGQTTAPLYRLEGIKTPLMLLTGGRDRLADPQDMEALRDLLPRDLLQRQLHVEEYEHLDFVWAHDAHTRLYTHVLDFLTAALPPRAAAAEVRGTAEEQSYQAA